jgi:hypothetical protein
MRAALFLSALLLAGVSNAHAQAAELVGEAGYQAGKDQRLSTAFDNFDTDTGKFYGGLGLRVGL